MVEEGTGTVDAGAEEDIDPLDEKEEDEAVEVDPTGRFARVGGGSEISCIGSIASAQESVGCEVELCALSSDVPCC